jgi:hypothetical protein
MYSLDLETVDKAVYRRENSSVQAKVSHDEPAKIRSCPAGPIQALDQTIISFFVLITAESTFTFFNNYFLGYFDSL